MCSPISLQERYFYQVRNEVRILSKYEEKRIFCKTQIAPKITKSRHSYFKQIQVFANRKDERPN